MNEKYNKISIDEIYKSYFETLCSVLSNYGVEFEVEEDELMVKFAYELNNKKTDFLAFLDSINNVIVFVGYFPIKFIKSVYTSGCVALSLTNLVIPDGEFYLDTIGSNLAYKLTNTLVGIELNEEMISHFYTTCIEIVNKYQDHLITLGNSEISLNEYSNIILK